MPKDFKGDVGFGDKGYGGYARSRGYARLLGFSFPNLNAPPGAVGTAVDAPPDSLADAPPGAVGFGDKGYGSYASSPGYADVGLGDKGYGRYAEAPGYADVGLGDKGYGSYARSRGYAKLGMSYPNMRAPAPNLGSTKKR